MENNFCEYQIMFVKKLCYIKNYKNNESTIKLSKVINGVDRKTTQLGNPFHIDNLAVNAASIAAFGDTEKNNHRQIHHRQLLQSLHNLFT